MTRGSTMHLGMPNVGSLRNADALRHRIGPMSEVMEQYFDTQNPALISRRGLLKSQS